MHESVREDETKSKSENKTEATMHIRTMESSVKH